MNEVTFRISDSYEDICRIHDALYEFNLSRTGLAREDVKAKKRPGQQALLATVDNGSTVCGGIVFHPGDRADTLYVDFLFLDDRFRGKGAGKKLWNKFEALAEEKGISMVYLTTNTFQAPGFYLSMGFEETDHFAFPVPLVPDNIRYSLCKRLNPC